MIQLKTWQIREFIKIASVIPDESKTLPALGYYLISPDGTITKSAHSSNCSLEIEFIEGTSLFDQYPNALEEKILVNIKTLNDFAGKTKKDYIGINYDKTKKELYITDGEYNTQIEWEDAVMFPEPGFNIDDNFIGLDNLFVKTLGIASNFIRDDEGTSNLSYVHVKEDFIAGIGLGYMYMKEFPGKILPNMVLDSGQIRQLSQFDSLRFSESDNHYCFKTTTGATFIFSKPEAATPAIRTLLEIIKGVTVDPFIVQRSDLVDFCDFVNAIAITKTPYVEVKTNELDKPASFNMRDLEFYKQTEKKIPVKGIMPDFYFNPRVAIKPLKAYPHSELTVRIHKFQFLIYGKDHSYMAVAGLVNNAV